MTRNEYVKDLVDRASGISNELTRDLEKMYNTDYLQSETIDNITDKALSLISIIREIRIPFF